MDPSSTYDYAFKFILVGDAGVGKTSLMGLFLTGNFEENHESTIGVQFGFKTLSINGKSIKLQIWDTSGQEQFKALTRSYYRSSAAALVVFDIARRETFKSVMRWTEDIRTNANKDTVLVLVGNKCDLGQERTVTRNEALKFARDYEMLYIQTSARNKQNVERAFVWPANNILDKVEGGFISLDREDQAIKINSLVAAKWKGEKECSC